MNDRHLREIVEIVGVISIVAALLLVAWEIHQANRIAATEIELRLERNFDELNLRRAMSPDFAKLFPKLAAPTSHLVTATEEAQIQGLARHLVNAYAAVQAAHDRGLLQAQDLEVYRQDLAGTLERLPGLVPPMLSIHDSIPGMRAMPVLQPLRDAAARRVPATAEDTATGD
jgi:GNAT superfamily N-acetyltransferase